MEGCSPENAKSICARMFAAHGATREDAPGAQPPVDVGAEGFDRAGDSIFIAPRQTVKIDDTAAKGKTLHFLCGFHAWMQGSFKVR